MHWQKVSSSITFSKVSHQTFIAFYDPGSIDKTECHPHELNIPLLHSLSHTEAEDWSLSRADCLF